MFLGILPLILEKSVQAQFLIPMAVSLGFGIVFTTVITMSLVPALAMLQFRASDKLGRLLGRHTEEGPAGSDLNPATA